MGVSSTSAGTVYPTYASYKAIKNNDGPQLEVWLMYWVVMGAVFTAESTVEWLFSWSVIAPHAHATRRPPPPAHARL